jgi:hypothetical protein
MYSQRNKMYSKRNTLDTMDTLPFVFCLCFTIRALPTIVECLDCHIFKFLFSFNILSLRFFLYSSSLLLLKMIPHILRELTHFVLNSLLSYRTKKISISEFGFSLIISVFSAFKVNPD